MMYNPTYEMMERDQLRGVQLERLQSAVKRVYQAVPFYRGKMQEAGISPDDIRSLDDLQKLPYTLKTDLRDNYPFGLFAVPMEEIVRVHASSGTTGKPTVVGYTQRDIDMWAECCARSLCAAGETRGGVIQVAYGYGLFTGGLGMHYGAEKLGATVIPMSGGNTARQLMLMEDFGATTICCTPSYALMLGETLKEKGVPMENIKLRTGVFGAEPWTEEMRTSIENLFGINAMDVYGLSETMGPGVAMECLEGRHGLHIWEDHFIPEIIDPETGRVLPDGETGELAITTITKEGLPTIRYRTRDLTHIIAEPCVCGRTHRRIARLRGRTDDMLIIRGVNVFPTQVESVLANFEGVAPHYMLVVDRINNLDTLEVQVEMVPELVSDEVRVVEDLGRRLRSRIESSLGISVTLTLVGPKTIQRSEGKAKRITDKRKLYD